MAHVTTEKDEGCRVIRSTRKAAYVANGMPWTVQQVKRAVSEVVKGLEAAYVQGIRTFEIDLPQVSAPGNTCQAFLSRVVIVGFPIHTCSRFREWASRGWKVHLGASHP